jgi:DNA-binding HxlR family transcriptional regulator
MQRKNVEDAVMRVLGHSERRTILRILENAPEGVKYSGILGETGLTTSKLNYQLKEMVGFIEKDDDGLYRLTQLGRKAVGVLDHMSEDLDAEAIELEPVLENQRRSFIKRKLNNVFYVLMALFGVGPIVLTYFYFAEPGSGITPTMLALSYVVLCGIVYAFDQARRSSPRYMLGLVDWLDWKFFNGDGEGRFRGRKAFVLTALGLIIGALLGKAGLGLILGLFLGAAMEIG